jgi:hypothetical protein
VTEEYSKDMSFLDDSARRSYFMWKSEFKKLDPNNWLQPDKTNSFFVGMENSDEYVKVVLGAKLSKNVPKNIQALFEIARGAMLYGYLFYPLFALAAGQLFRVAEAALVHKFDQLGMPKDKKRFVERIEYLEQQGIFSHDKAHHWHTIRHLRNSETHVTSQSIIPPRHGIELLYSLAEDINKLFENSEKRTSFLVMSSAVETSGRVLSTPSIRDQISPFRLRLQSR